MPGGGFTEGKRFLQIKLPMRVYGSLSGDFECACGRGGLSSEVRSVATRAYGRDSVRTERNFTEAPLLSPRSPYSASQGIS